MTKDEQTTRHLRGKVSSLVGSPLATSQPSSNGKKPLRGQKIAKFLHVTKDNSETWDIVQKTTPSTDARSQKVQESLIKGIIPIARLQDPLGKEGPIPSPGELWKGLSKSVLWIASAIHDLNMCRPDIFKVDLDDTCNAKLFSNDPVE